MEDAEQVDLAPGEYPEYKPDPELEPTPIMAEDSPATDDTAETDGDFVEIGKDALLELLTSARTVLGSEEFQSRLVDQVDRITDIPYMPDAIEASVIDKAYDIVQEPAVAALDDWISDLEE